MDTILSKLRALNLPEPIAVVGMGVSGRAALDILREAGYDAQGFDEKKTAPHVTQVSFDDDAVFAAYSTLVISPGIDRRRRAFQASYAHCVNDVEIFARVVDKPIMAVTGSNGKSTVVTLLSHALQALGHQVCLCGNIGRSVLEALLEKHDQTDVYVVELSSYQLELCPSLRPKVGAVINVTPDHLDRYDSFDEYFAAKAKLAQQAQVIVLNADDPHCRTMGEQALNPIYFGTKAVEANRVEKGFIYLNGQPLLTTDSLALTGTHNHANVLCVMLMLEALDEPLEHALLAIQQFGGLDHRMQLVAEKNGVRWINDSKATNIGATIAALSGLSAPIILILGGLGKQQDFAQLSSAVANSSVREVLLIGEDAGLIADALAKDTIAFSHCHTLENAVYQAAKMARKGEVVLLSPACASFDQFSGFAERGASFAKWVTSL